MHIFYEVTCTRKGGSHSSVTILSMQLQLLIQVQLMLRATLAKFVKEKLCSSFLFSSHFCSTSFRASKFVQVFQ